MLQLLIVDDESATRNGLLRHIDWKSLGIEMIQTAGSAQEALALCENFRPDIVLSDIRMRGMNGVEMCGVLQERFPDLQIIFISGYSDKEYLKAAIALRAVDYVEKPINAAALRETVARAVGYCLEIKERAKHSEMLDQSASYLRRELLFALLEGQTDFENLPGRLEEAGLSFSHPNLRAGLLLTSEPVTNIDRFLQSLETALEGDCRCQCWEELREFQDNRSMALVLQGPATMIGDNGYALRRWQYVAEEGVEGIRLHLGLGPVVQGVEALAASWAGAVAASEALFFEDYGHIRAAPRKEGPILVDQDSLEEFANALQAGEKQRAAQVLRELEARLREAEVGKGAFVNNIYFTLATRVYEQFSRLFPNDDAAAETARHREYQRMEDARTLRELTGILLEQVDGLVEAGGKEEQGSLTVSKVIRMIGRQYGDTGLSVRALANSVYLTPTYLSALFKRKTGKTIGEYITGVRMEQAVKLLRDSSLKLYQVALQVGYEDANYFAKIFKKHVGVSPSTFRDKL